MLSKRILTLVSLLLISFLLVGCMLPSKNHAPVITTTELPDAIVEIAYTATVEATDADGDALTFSKVIGPTDMLISEAGVISGWTPAEAGTEIVKVAVTDGKDSVIAKFTITVSEPELELTGIVVAPKTITLFVGESRTITSVTAKYSDGSIVPIALGNCTYSSSAPGVAAVIASEGYTVNAIAKGTTTITVDYAGKSDAIAVTVSEPEPEPKIELTGIVVAPKAMTLFVGDTEAIKSVTATYEIRGYEIPIALGECNYLSDNEEVATVTNAGLVEAVAEGVATITVSYREEITKTVYIEKTDTIAVTVSAVLLDHIVVDPDEMTLMALGHQLFEVTAYYNNDTSADITSECDYTTSNFDVAHILVDGILHYVQSISLLTGTATITVTYVDMEDEIVVTVIDKVHNTTQGVYYNTIQAAIDDADPDNTILVSAGTYEETLVLIGDQYDPLVDVAGLILKSVIKHGAEIKGRVRIEADAVTIEDFYINFDSITLAPVDLGLIEGVTIRGNKVEGGTDAGGISSWTGSTGAHGIVLIENNEVIKGCIGLYFDFRPASVTIRNNTMTDPADEGIWTVQNSNAFLTIENNTVTGAGLTDVKIGVDKPLLVNGVAVGTDMAQAILDANSGIYDVYLEWIPETLTR